MTGLKDDALPVDPMSRFLKLPDSQGHWRIQARRLSPDSCLKNTVLKPWWFDLKVTNGPEVLWNSGAM